MQGAADWQQIIFICVVMGSAASAGVASIIWFNNRLASVKAEALAEYKKVCERLESLQARLEIIAAQQDRNMHAQALTFEQVIGALRMSIQTDLSSTRHSIYTRIDVVRAELDERMDGFDERLRDVQIKNGEMVGLVEGLKVGVETLRPILSSMQHQPGKRAGS